MPDVPWIHEVKWHGSCHPKTQGLESMIMFILLLGDIFEVVGRIAAVEDVIFPKSLIGATMQDGG